MAITTDLREGWLHESACVLHLLEVDNMSVLLHKAKKVGFADCDGALVRHGNLNSIKYFLMVVLR